MKILCPKCKTDNAELVYRLDDPWKDKMIKCDSCGLYDFYERYNKKKNDKQTAKLL